MYLELLLSYSIVLSAMVLAVGVINIYYFLDFVLQKENRKKLFKVWLLGLFALSVHSVGHIAEVMLENNIIYSILELTSLSIVLAAMAILVKNTLNFYAFIEIKKQLEMAVEKRTNELRVANKGLSQKVEELEKWQRLTVGRELKMKELKSDIKELKERLEKHEST
jgi:C4-dicarboxylate-specific signal transduction histidine kinase